MNLTRDDNSVVGSLAVEPAGIYPWLASIMVLVPCLDVTWMYRTAQATAMLAMICHVSWVVWNWKRGVALDCMVETVFDIPFMPLLTSCSASFT